MMDEITVKIYRKGKIKIADCIYNKKKEKEKKKKKKKKEKKKKKKKKKKMQNEGRRMPNTKK